MKYKILLGVFIILYFCVGFVSCYHAISFFSISNPTWLAVILSLAFEIGQAVVLFTILINDNKKKTLPWILMGILTLVQVLGNVFSSYKFAIINNQSELIYFTKSVLFFVQSPNPDYNYVMISYITGAILPVVSLCLTAMVVNILKQDKKETEKVEIIKETQKESKEDKLYT